MLQWALGVKEELLPLTLSGFIIHSFLSGEIDNSCELTGIKKICETEHQGKQKDNKPKSDHWGEKQAVLKENNSCGYLGSIVYVLNVNISTVWLEIDVLQKIDCFVRRCSNRNAFYITCGCNYKSLFFCIFRAFFVFLVTFQEYKHILRPKQSKSKKTKQKIIAWEFWTSKRPFNPHRLATAGY